MGEEAIRLCVTTYTYYVNSANIHTANWVFMTVCCEVDAKVVIIHTIGNVRNVFVRACVCG